MCRPIQAMFSEECALLPSASLPTESWNGSSFIFFIEMCVGPSSIAFVVRNTMRQNFEDCVRYEDRGQKEGKLTATPFSRDDKLLSIIDA